MPGPYTLMIKPVRIMLQDACQEMEITVTPPSVPAVGRRKGGLRRSVASDGYGIPAGHRLCAWQPARFAPAGTHPDRRQPAAGRPPARRPHLPSGARDATASPPASYWTNWALTARSPAKASPPRYPLGHRAHRRMDERLGQTPPLLRTQRRRRRLFRARPCAEPPRPAGAVLRCKKLMSGSSWPVLRRQAWPAVRWPAGSRCRSTTGLGSLRGPGPFRRAARAAAPGAGWPPRWR